MDFRNLAEQVSLGPDMFLPMAFHDGIHAESCLLSKMSPR